MEKLKKTWENNRVLIVLGVIVLTCIIVMSCVMVKYFFGGSTSSYGDRLDDIADLPYKDEDKETLKEAIKQQEIVSDVDIKAIGKIIYIRILFNEKANIDSAKQVAATSLENIAKEYQEKYDIQFTIVQESAPEIAGFTIMGAKNINRQNLVWNNNTPEKTE